MNVGRTSRPRSGGIVVFRHGRSESGRGRKAASAAGGGDGADADRFTAHVKKTLQEFDESAL